MREVGSYLYEEWPLRLPGKGVVKRRTVGGQGRSLPWGRLMARLERYYSRGTWRRPVLRRRGAPPFLVLVSTILSHRTRDEVTARATIRLMAAFPTPRALSRTSVPRVRALIREVGLSEEKATGLVNAARAIMRDHDGRVPVTEDELLRIPLVGPKTAHAVLVFGHRMPGLPVDTHILRVTRRLGIVHGHTIKEAQEELALTVPRRYWGLLNPILVQHGMNTCTSPRPKCVGCPIDQWCERVGVQ